MTINRETKPNNLGNMQNVLWLFFVAITTFTPTVISSKSHPVTTFLNAKWYRTPVCLEIAEYLFDESPTLFWDYVEKLNALKTPLHTIGTYRSIDFHSF